jgi:hypothetical protein
VELAIPFFIKAYEQALVLKKKSEPYRLDLLLPTFFGLVMCFFGGNI